MTHQQFVTRNVLKESKILLSLLAVFFLVVTVFRPEIIEADFARNSFLPSNKDISDPVKRYVFEEVRKAGLDVEEVSCLIQHESGWNQWAYNLNTNGSTDFGIWMINSIHKGTINVEDRWDYKKATQWAIEKRLRDGNWNAWYGYLNNCK